MASVILTRGLRAAALAGKRAFSSSQRWLKPIDLAFEHYPAPSGANKDGSIVICHGLFGSKQNWRSLAKTMAKNTHKDVYAVDLRNHGTSPHVEPHDYPSMASDLSHFMRSNSLDNVSLIGHSMGGKAVMAFALSSDAELLRHLIVVDIAPGVGKISPEFASYVDGMKEVEVARVTSKRDADDILQKYEPALPIRQFLLTNLERPDPEKPYKFRIPLELLGRAVPAIGDFPHAPGDGAKWEGPTLFIKGEKSKYINSKNIPIAEEFFPNMKLEKLGTGHWVQSEKPAEFLHLVTDFVKNQMAT